MDCGALYGPWFIVGEWRFDKLAAVVECALVENREGGCEMEGVKAGVLGLKVRLGGGRLGGMLVWL